MLIDSFTRPSSLLLCATSEGLTPILIIFHHLLYFIYGGEIDEEDLFADAKDLINGADKDGVTKLELETKVWNVNRAEITIGNAVDDLLCADAMNCALLEEVVIDFIVEN